MTPETVIRQAAAEGVRLALSPPDNIEVAGDERVVDRWLPVIREYKPGIMAALRQATGEPLPDPAARPATQADTFTFAPPGDPESDTEALEERAAIIAEGCGIGQEQALQEALWQADRERCWRAFLRNAARVLAAPEGEREGLLAIYATEASRRYGERTGADMAASLRGWVNARAVH